MVGSILYLTPDRRSIRRVQPDGSNNEPVLTFSETEAPIEWYSVSPTGDYLIYLRHEGTQPEDWHWVLSLFRDGRSQQLDFPFVRSHAWSPDGTRLALSFSPDAADPTTTRVSIYDVPTGQTTPLPISGAPSWFPDGKSLLLITSRQVTENPERWWRYTPSTSDLVRYDLATSTSITLTDLLNTPRPGLRSDVYTDTWVISWAHPHPDGEHALFMGNQDIYLGATGNNSRGWAIDLDDGIPYGWAGGGRTSDHRFSPAGTHMAYVSNFHNNACDNPESLGVVTTDLLDPEGGGFSLFSELEHDDPTQPAVRTAFDGLDWSPAGDQLVFAAEAYTCQGASQREVISDTALYVWDVQTGQDHTVETVPRELLAGGTQPFWIDRGALAHPGLIPLPVPPPPTPQTLPTTTTQIEQIAAADTEHIWLTVRQTRPLLSGVRLLTTEDGGTTWRERAAFTAPVDALVMVSPQDGWAIIGGAVQTTRDGGATWQPTDTQPHGSTTRLAALDTQHVWVGAERTGGLDYSADGGQTWEQLRGPLSPGTFAFSNPTTGWITYGGREDNGWSQTLLRTEDSGHTWEFVTHATGQAGSLPGIAPASLSVIDDTTGWLAGGWLYRGEDRPLWRTSDGGQTWQEVWLPVPGLPVAVHFTDERHGIVRVVYTPHSDRSYQTMTLLRTTDGGQTWEQIYP
jgi:photosystem II stability/assembly factor-like uncharacterized protein